MKKAKKAGRGPNSSRSAVGRQLETGLKEMLAHVRGEKSLPVRRIVLPEEVDVARIRADTGMSQLEFARTFCISPRTLQDWEQGRRTPDATSRAYLAVIDRNRQAVLDALAG